jgi:hypothetical protein
MEKQEWMATISWLRDVCKVEMDDKGRPPLGNVIPAVISLRSANHQAQKSVSGFRD